MRSSLRKGSRLGRSKAEAIASLDEILAESYVRTLFSRIHASTPEEFEDLTRVGWPIAASLSGRFYLRIGFKRTALIGLSLALLVLQIGHPWRDTLAASIADTPVGNFTIMVSA